MKSCRLHGGDLLPLWDLGTPSVSDFPETPSVGTAFPLRLAMGPNSALLQLEDTFDPEQMYRNYYYRSGTNPTMVRALQEIVDATAHYTTVETGDVVVDVGANDGTLLGCWPERVRRVAFEPAANFGSPPPAFVDAWIPDFFRAEGYPETERAKVITSIAMFYDLEDPRRFVRDVETVLHEEGVWVCQMSYLPLMLTTQAWDNICAEHLTYWSLETFSRLLWDSPLCVVDTELNAVNGGSFRLYLMHGASARKRPSYQQELGMARVAALTKWEETLHLDSPVTWNRFRRDCLGEGQRLVNFLRDCRERGRRVIGYGASTKGNTLLQGLGITPELLPVIADRSPQKWGRYCAGSGIPIISEEEMRKMRPDYLLALPWHFLDHFLERERELLNLGTRFVVPLPHFQVVES